MLAMATHDKGNDGQIASAWATGTSGKLTACGGSEMMGKSSRLQWPHPARATTGESPARMMATQGEGNNRQIVGACGDSNDRQVDGVHRECNQNNNHPITGGAV